MEKYQVEMLQKNGESISNVYVGGEKSKSGKSYTYDKEVAKQAIQDRRIIYPNNKFRIVTTSYSPWE